MKSKFISSAVVAVAVLSSFGASAETFNSFVFDQIAAPTQRTRAEVKAEIQAPVTVRAKTVVASSSSSSSGSSYYGALAQQNLNTSSTQKNRTTAPVQADIGSVQTSQK